MHLSPGEKRVFEGHPSWRSSIALYMRGALLTALAAATAAGVTALLGDGVAVGVVATIALAGLALTALVAFVQRISTVYTITSRRLHVKRGIVSRVVQETRLSRVQTAGYSQSLTERLLNIGTIDFDTAAVERDYEFRFSGVADPAGVVRAVDRAVAISDEDARDGLGGPAGR